MKKYFVMLALASVFCLSIITPSSSADGIIISIRQTPIPTQTPVPKKGEGGATIENNNPGEVLIFWEFLQSFF